MTATDIRYCGFHHGPADKCPPVDPDLGDLLHDLTDRNVPIRLVPLPKHTARCEDCITDPNHDGIADAVAYVCHRVPADTRPDGFVYRVPICPVHIWANVLWDLRRGCETWIEIPHDFGQVAS